MCLDVDLLPEHEDGLEIILGGFINVHCKGSFPALRAVSGGKKCRLSPKAPPGPPLSLFPLTHSTTNPGNYKRNRAEGLQAAVFSPRREMTKKDA